MRSRWHAARSLLLLVAAVAAASAATAPGGAASRPSGGGTTTHGRLTARTHDLLRGLGSGRRVRGAAVPKQFLYVYDVPPEFTTDIQALPVQWHPEQYDYDQVVHRHLLESEIRTLDPVRAQLFFIPAYLGRFFNAHWQQWSTPGDAWDIAKDCKPEQTPDACWWEKWTGAKNATSELVRQLLTHVRAAHPHFNESNGADHVMVFSYDHARCDLAPALRLSEWGQLLSIQSYGDLTYTNVPAVPPLVQRNGASYEWAGARAWACYRPDADVLLPMFYQYDAADVVPPMAGPRNISALLRFGCKKGDGKNLVEHYGHRLRQELLASWAADPLEGSVAGLTSKEQTDADMAAATFCLCPPGATQDSTRMWRALLRGCIPVTFFRANDLPFARHLGVAYSDFIVNLQPDDVGRTQAVLRRLLEAPARVRRMQDALALHQRLFIWAAGAEGGVLASLERELAIRAGHLADGPQLALT